MTRLSATDAAVQVMLDEGVEIVFGIPGGALRDLPTRGGPAHPAQAGVP